MSRRRSRRLSWMPPIVVAYGPLLPKSHSGNPMLVGFTTCIDRFCRRRGAAPISAR